VRTRIETIIKTND
jgi:hypothetical protein